MNESRTIRPLVKWSVVIAGYIIAFAIANAFVNARDLRSSPQDQASSGMFAWGDMILFLEVFGLAAIIPTALALYFLRPIQGFWIVLSIGAIAFAATGLVAAPIVALTSQMNHEPSLYIVQLLAVLGIMREMMSPAAAIIFVLATFTAPTRHFRLALLAATVIEVSLGLYSFHRWYAPIHVL
jgi:hypothetical protein